LSMTQFRINPNLSTSLVARLTRGRMAAVARPCRKA